MPLEQQQERGQENEDTPAVQMPLCPPKLSIHPPLLNTACPWATTEADDLQHTLEAALAMLAGE